MGEKTVKKYICVRCPRGCEISTTLDGYTIESIQGNVCKLGVEYVNDEISAPKRMVTTTVKVKNGEHILVPVWTEKAIPKDKILDLIKLLNEIELEAPVNIDEVVISNVFNTGINVITSGKVKKKIPEI